MTNDYGNLELHKVLLKAMKDFDNFCEKYNLKYCLHGGTCLGAIRHKGFIPWDDDVDIVMLRSDYDKFLKIAQKEWGEKYFIETYKTESNILCNVAKIRINESGFISADARGENKGLFLDVFPLSDVPNSKILQKIQNKLAIFLNNIVYAKMGYIELVSLKSKLCFGLLSKLPRRFLGDILECVIKYFPHFHSEYVNIVATANYLGCTGYATDLNPKKYFKEIHRTRFEDGEFYITDHWDEYLKKMYGDYMTPLKKEDRTNKHGIKKGE